MRHPRISRKEKNGAPERIGVIPDKGGITACFPDFRLKCFLKFKTQNTNFVKLSTQSHDKISITLFTLFDNTIIILSKG